MRERRIDGEGEEGERERERGHKAGTIAFLIFCKARDYFIVEGATLARHPFRKNTVLAFFFLLRVYLLD